MRLVQDATNALAAQRGYLFPWVPVCFGVGIGGYFALPVEPTKELLIGVLFFSLLTTVCGIVGPAAARPVVVCATLICLGLVLAAVRAQSLATPKLDFRYYGPVEGRVVVVDRSQSNAVRLTLDQVRMEDISPKETPERVRISLHGEFYDFSPEPGHVIATTAHLSPPAGPVEPGGFDFQRQAWFQQLGAVGYTRSPVLKISPPVVDSFGVALAHLRSRLSASVRAQMPGRAGNFAAAITTGDRSGIDQATLDDLRAANLAHLLAISGLHMGLLTGFVFVVGRSVLALCGLSLKRSGKKIAACVALLAGAGYLALSGGNVATERAFVMVAVMFGAVLLNRRAVTLRAVAVAAIIVLALRPETVHSPGFHMSFAATVALVAVYRWLREKEWSIHGWSAPARVIGGVALSSAVAGLATAPFAAAHFNQVPHYGLIANILSVPLMGLIIMPAAVVAAILALFGLSWIGLAAMKWPILWILEVADRVAQWPGSVSHVVAPGPMVLPLLALGGLWLAIWRGRGRVMGSIIAMAGFLVWSQADRPDILISDTGGLIGIMTDQGRAMTKPRGDGFSARSWLENDGDPVEQSSAFERLGDVEVLVKNGLRIVHATGKRASLAAAERCDEADIVVVNVSVDTSKDCQIVDSGRLRQTGSLAIFMMPNGEARLVTAREIQGARLWSQ